MNTLLVGKSVNNLKKKCRLCVGESFLEMFFFFFFNYNQLLLTGLIYNAHLPLQ